MNEEAKAIVAAALARGWVKPAAVVPVEMSASKIWRSKYRKIVVRADAPKRNYCRIKRVRAALERLPEEFRARDVARVAKMDRKRALRTLNYMVERQEIRVVQANTFAMPVDVAVFAKV